MVTLVGTVASVVSLLLSWTTKGVEVMTLRVTVAIAFPPFSLILLESRVRLRLTASLSITARVSEPLTNPWDVAIIV